MEYISVECPVCLKSTEINSGRGYGFCQYCGTRLEIKKENEESMNATNTHRRVNDLSIALKQAEEQYFNGFSSFAQVMQIYEDAEMVGLEDSDYWLSRARFYAKGNLKEFAEGRVFRESRKEIIDQYLIWMQNAIVQFVGNSISLKMEKEQTIGEINNALEGPKMRVAISGDDLAADLVGQGEMPSDEEIEAAANKIGELAKKHRNIIIAVVAVVILLFGLLLRSCMGNDVLDEPVEEYDVAGYEEFLELGNIMELFTRNPSRRNILNLDIDFGDQSFREETLRVIAPPSAQLAQIVFYFDEEDLLERVSIRNASIFNEMEATGGLDEDLVAAFNTEELVLTNDILSFSTNGLDVVVTLRSNYFNITVARADIDYDEEDELTDEQQAVWDMIEARVFAGYNSWADLIAWAEGQNIAFDFFESEVRPLEAIRQLIFKYGVFGDYVNATAYLGSAASADEVILALHFENLSYNPVIAQLYGLNRNSNRELNAWLENDGEQRLKTHFRTVEISSIDYDTDEIITEMPEVVEFVNWSIEYLDKFAPVGEGRVAIQRVYRIIEIEDEDDDEDEEPDDGSTVLQSGSWTVGPDIRQGRYVISGDGIGNFSIWRGSDMLVNEVLSNAGNMGVNTITTYILNGDEIDISNIPNVTFKPVENRGPRNTLSAGNWIVGDDIRAGYFYATAPNGIGTLIIWRGNELLVNEILHDGSANVGEDRIMVQIQRGDIITITGLNKVVFE